MIMPGFNSQQLREWLATLSKEKQLAFGAACCERLVPNYVLFQQDSGFGDVRPVRDALDLIWSFLEGRQVSENDINEATLACESAAPNSDISTSLFVTAAQDACFAICCLLDYLHENNVDKIVQVATYATDSVDLYVQEVEHLPPNDLQLEEKILAHPLMQRELVQQRIDLGAIEQASQLNHQFFSHLKALWKNDGRGNLDLP